MDCLVVFFFTLSSFVLSLLCFIFYFNSILSVRFFITYATTGRITTFENTEEYYELFGLLLKVRRRVLSCCCCCYCYCYHCLIIQFCNSLFFLYYYFYFYFYLFTVDLCILIFVLHSLFTQDNKAENVEEKMNTTKPYSRPIVSDNSLLPSPSPSSPPSTPSSTPSSSSSSSSPLPYSPYSSPTPPSPLPQLSSSPPLSLPFSSLYSFSSDSISLSFHHHNYREIAFEKIPSNYSYSLSNSTIYSTDLINKKNEYDNINNSNNKNHVKNRQINENESYNMKTNKMKKSSKNNKRSFLHTNSSDNKSNKNKKNIISELGKQIFSIYFTDLNLEFLRKHGGGGNGIELLIKELSIAGSDSKNRKKSGEKYGFCFTDFLPLFILIYSFIDEI